MGPGTGPAADSGGPRPRQRLCLAVLDLDQFKEINDTQGHAAGDRVLQAVGQSFRKYLRQDDFVARLGGDEFGLLLWAPGEAEAAAIVDRLKRRRRVGLPKRRRRSPPAPVRLSGTISRRTRPNRCSSRPMRP